MFFHKCEDFLKKMKVFEGRRVGEFAGELKINAKRPQKKIKDDIEERKTQRNKKQQPKASKRGPK